jgi:hypothetical protein
MLEPHFSQPLLRFSLELVVSSKRLACGKLREE